MFRCGVKYGRLRVEGVGVTLQGMVGKQGGCSFGQKDSV